MCMQFQLKMRKKNTESSPTSQTTRNFLELPLRILKILKFFAIKNSLQYVLHKLWSLLWLQQLRDGLESTTRRSTLKRFIALSEIFIPTLVTLKHQSLPQWMSTRDNRLNRNPLGLIKLSSSIRQEGLYRDVILKETRLKSLKTLTLTIRVVSKGSPSRSLFRIRRKLCFSFCKETERSQIFATFLTRKHRLI